MMQRLFRSKDNYLVVAQRNPFLFYMKILSFYPLRNLFPDDIRIFITRPPLN